MVGGSIRVRLPPLLSLYSHKHQDEEVPRGPGSPCLLGSASPVKILSPFPGDTGASY